MMRNKKEFAGKGNLFSDNSQAPLYDRYGRRITNQRDIEAEVERRRAEWREWEEQGLIREEICQNPDGSYTVWHGVNHLDNTNPQIITDNERFMEIEEGESSSLTSQSHERTLHSLQEELARLRSLPRPNNQQTSRVQELERQIAHRQQREQDFTHRQVILPKK